jgi:hypothetical protein
MDSVTENGLLRRVLPKEAQPRHGSSRNKNFPVQVFGESLISSRRLCPLAGRESLFFPAKN